LVLAGLDWARRVFKVLDPEARFASAFNDGDKVQTNDAIATIAGQLRALLTGERTALNFLQRLCGIATFTRLFVEKTEGTKVRLTDTRKTIPGWRRLEKYAVRVGGAYNHRLGLYDGILIKDNHIVACGGISEAEYNDRRRQIILSDPASK